MPSTTIRNTVVKAPITPPTALGNLGNAAQRLLDQPLNTGRIDDIAMALEPGECAQGLRLNRRGQLRGLIGDLAAGEKHQPDQKGDGQQQHDGHPPAAPDLQHPAQQPRAAIDQRGKDHAAENDQQRFGEQHRQCEQGGHAQPDESALGFLPQHRIGDVGWPSRLAWLSQVLCAGPFLLPLLLA